MKSLRYFERQMQRLKRRKRDILKEGKEEGDRKREKGSEIIFGEGVMMESWVV